MARADELATTDAERACLSALREVGDGHVGRSDGAHCVRLFLIPGRIAADRGIDVDPELLLCASFLHDVGLYPSVTTGDVYVTDSRRVAERTLAPFDWQHTRLARCLDAIEQHHAQRSRWDWGAEVELIRRADLVDLSRGLINFGVDRGWLRDLFREIPRRGLYHLIAASLVRRDGRHPSNLARIFLPPREPTRVQDS